MECNICNMCNIAYSGLFLEVTVNTCNICNINSSGKKSAEEVMHIIYAILIFVKIQ